MTSGYCSNRKLSPLQAYSTVPYSTRSNPCAACRRLCWLDSQQWCAPLRRKSSRPSSPSERHKAWLEGEWKVPRHHGQGAVSFRFVDMFVRRERVQRRNHPRRDDATACAPLGAHAPRVSLPGTASAEPASLRAGARPHGGGYGCGSTSR